MTPTDTRPATERRVGRKRTSRASDQTSPWVVGLFLLPALVLYALLVLYPIAQSVNYSVFNWNGLEALTNFVGIDNFRTAFSDPLFLEAMRHNAIIIALSLLVQIPFALAVAVLLNQNLRGRVMLRVFFFAPYVLSEVVTGVVFRQILRPGGLVDQSLRGVGGEGLVQTWLGDPKIVLYTLFFVISWKYFGFHMILLLAGLQLIPHELDEAASIDGATWWQRFRYVTLPLVGPTLRVSVFLSIIGSIQLFDLVWVMTKGGPVNASSTMATYLVDWGFRRSEFGYASAVSVIIFAVSLVVAVFYIRFVLKRDLEGALTG
ncbi:MAG: sugar ABC transporter permease [Acidimicrobiia bacterium]|jgi:raffinose/stachyose/melibiose transport system permease protein